MRAELHTEGPQPGEVRGDGARDLGTARTGQQEQRPRGATVLAVLSPVLHFMSPGRPPHLSSL